MQTLFIAGFGPIVRDLDASRTFYENTLSLTLEGDPGYRHTGGIDGCKSFGLWRLEDAAELCFGVSTWPADLPAPTSWLEFDVADMAQAIEQLEAAGHRLLIKDRTEPWGQTVTRFLSPEGILVGCSITPWLRPDAGAPAEASA